VTRDEQRAAIMLEARRLERKLRGLSEDLDEVSAAGDQEEYDLLCIERWGVQEQIDQVLSKLPEIRYWREDLWGKRPFCTHLVAQLPKYEVLVAEAKAASRS
jgi:hypothetical protein